jgi:hypothetical protein
VRRAARPAPLLRALHQRRRDPQPPANLEAQSTSAAVPFKPCVVGGGVGGSRTMRQWTPANQGWAHGAGHAWTHRPRREIRQGEKVRWC